MLSPIRLVSRAAEFAARRHTGKARKARPDEPYVNHLAEVADILAEVTDGTDAELVAAGWLHDTVEDTETTREELAQKFGERVASLVVEVTDDMNLSQTERRQRQVEDAPHKSPGAKLIKIADKISNIRARIVPNPAQAQRSDLVAYAIWAEKVVAPRRQCQARCGI
jgi:guanosine-3',5'-bis(diphosphate) 3'-pyrophosphohydrolase